MPSSTGPLSPAFPLAEAQWSPGGRMPDGLRESPPTLLTAGLGWRLDRVGSCLLYWRDGQRYTDADFADLSRMAADGLPVLAPLALARTAGAQALCLPCPESGCSAAGYLSEHWHEHRARTRLLHAVLDLLERLIEAARCLPNLALQEFWVEETSDALRCRLLGGVPSAGLARLDEMYRVLAPFATEAAEITPTGSELRKDLPDIWPELFARLVVAEGRQWSARRRAISGAGPLCAEADTTFGPLLYRGGQDPVALAGAVQAHRNLVLSAPQDLLKKDRKRVLSKVFLGGQWLVVKEYCRTRPILPHLPAEMAWRYNWRMEFCGLPVPRFHGLLRCPGGPAYIIQEYIPGELFDTALLRSLVGDVRRSTPTADPRALSQALLHLLAALYRWGIIHRDYKAQNVIVTSIKSPPGLSLIDNDRVRFGRRIRPRDWARNRWQLDETLPVREDVYGLLDEAFAEAKRKAERE